MYDPKRYLLSLCTCMTPTRTHDPSRRPDVCARCGGIIPSPNPNPTEVKMMTEREQFGKCAAIWVLFLLAIVILSLFVR